MDTNSEEIREAIREMFPRVEEEDIGFECRACGRHIERHVRDGRDIDCPRCGQTHNCFGQRIDFPQGQGEDYAGERWDDDY